MDDEAWLRAAKDNGPRIGDWIASTYPSHIPDENRSLAHSVPRIPCPWIRLHMVEVVLWMYLSRQKGVCSNSKWGMAPGCV